MNLKLLRITHRPRIASAIILLGLTAATASGKATLNHLSVRAVAEVEVKVMLGGQETVKLAAADRVVPGDEVVYTLEIRNIGAVAAKSPVVEFPIPAHMAYVADTATGPGAEVSYSIDGGHSFASPNDLHLNKPSNYTTIRWKLKNDLKPNSVAFARFRAIVK